ncbi:hypothetical protein JCM5353_004251 [Sporobolomyces roseus]
MGKTLLLTVGSTEFTSLVESFFHPTLINQLSSSLGITSVYAQIGNSRLPKGWELGVSEVEGVKFEVVRFTGDLEKRVAGSQVVISHAGAGSILSFLRPLSTPSTPSDRRLILVPNDTFMDSHQNDLADEMEKYDCIRVCRDSKALLKTIEALGKEEERDSREGNQQFPEFDKKKVQRILNETLGYA